MNTEYLPRAVGFRVPRSDFQKIERDLDDAFDSVKKYRPLAYGFERQEPEVDNENSLIITMSFYDLCEKHNYSPYFAMYEDCYSRHKVCINCGCTVIIDFGGV